MIQAVADPIMFEILSHRLHQITKEMGITLERVGGTVNTTQMHDYIAALYRPNGDILCAGEGMPFHVAVASYAVKHIIERFEQGDGIHPGDMFLLNDPYVAAIHQSDVYVIGPIHNGDRLVAWSATFVHVMDIGAMSPGGNSPGAREICHEGVRIAGIKIVDRGQLRTDVIDAITNMTRQPEMVALDLRSEIAANNVARARVQELCVQCGPETLEVVADAMLRYSEETYRRRLREIPDGTWHAAGTVQSGDRWTIKLAMEKIGDRLVFDFSGTDAQAPVGINLPYHATVGYCYAALQSTIGYDIPKNHGGLAVIDVVAAPGTIVRPTPPAPVSLSTTSGGAMARYLTNTVLAQMAATSEQWRSEAMAQFMGSRFPRHAGLSQYGRYYVSTLRTLASEGATRDHDGVSSCLNGGWMSSHNVEWVELNFPLLHLYHRHVKDGAGAGQFRGGAGVEAALVIHDAPQGTIKGVALGVAGLRNAGDGLFGGYPSAPSLLVHVEGSHVRDFLARGVIPSTIEELGGERRLLPYCEIDLNGDDVLMMTSGGGGGYGDPLERDPRLVCDDVLDGLVSPSLARAVYGVVMLDDEVDPAATARARHDLNDERGASAAGDPRVSRNGHHGSGRNVHPLREHLSIVEHGGVQYVCCERCGHALCRAEADWMDATTTIISAPSDAGPLMSVLDDEYRLKRWCCPTCAVLLETQLISA